VKNARCEGPIAGALVASATRAGQTEANQFEATSSRVSTCRVPSLAVLAVLSWCAMVVQPWLEIPVACAQLLARTTVIENVSIHLPDGTVIEDGVVAIRGARIVAVGDRVTIPRNAIRIDGRGMHVTPGLIDLRSSLAMPASGSGGNQVVADAVDAFDRYDRRSIDEALSHGVTMVAVSPSAHRGFGPAVSVVRLRPVSGGTVGDAFDRRNAITLNMRSGDGPVARLQLVDAIRTQLREARERELALEAYERELEEFLEKIAEQDKAKENDTPARPSTGSSPTARPPAGRPAGDPRGGQPAERTRRPRPGASPDSDLDEGETESPTQQRPQRRGQRPAAAPTQQPAAGGQAPSSNRPTRPAPNRPLDVIIEAMNHEIAVRVQADRSEDILNAIEVANEFGLKIVIEGGAEAHLVASELAEAEVAVILTARPSSDLPRRGNQWRAVRNTAAILDRAGVEWGLGSEPGEDSRSLLFAAQWLVQSSGLQLDPIGIVTHRAARLLGVSDRVGSLTEGMQADVVLWSGDPSDPASQVTRVFVAGETVYERKEDS